MPISYLRSLLFAACSIALFSTASPATGASFDLEADLVELHENAFQAEADLINRIADVRTAEALAGLAKAYDGDATAYVRLLILRQLPQFDSVGGCGLDAAEMLANAISGSVQVELREAAFDSLERCEKNGPGFMAIIVDSTADPRLREAALRAHITMVATPDVEWHTRIWKKGIGVKVDPKADVPKRKKGDPPLLKKAVGLEALRAISFDVLVGELEFEEVRQASEDKNATIRVRAMEELMLRGEKKFGKRTEKIFGDRTERTPNRLLAAKLSLELLGPKFVKNIVKEAVRNITPRRLREGLAKMVAEQETKEATKAVKKGFGKGKSEAKLFYMMAARGHWDPKMEKGLLKMLGDKDVDVGRAAAALCVEMKVKSAAEQVEELFAEMEDPVRKGLLLPDLALFQESKKGWNSRLLELAKDPESNVRNAAIRLLGEAGKRNVDAIIETLDHELWSTRYASLLALEVCEEPKGVGAIIDRLDSQTGRMRVEYAETLFRMTGQIFGTRPTAWKAWWDDKGSKGFTKPSKSKMRIAQEDKDNEKLKGGSVSAFFGIRIVSQRLVFIVDVSGSMEELTETKYEDVKGMARMERAKEELLACLDGLHNDSFFNILPFSANAYPWKEGLLQRTPETMVEAKEFVEGLRAGGGTNLHDSLVSAFSDPDVDTIYLLSDGEPSMGTVIEPELIRLAVEDMNHNRGVKIHSIAIGGSLDILEWLAEDTGGEYRSFP